VAAERPGDPLTGWSARPLAIRLLAGILALGLVLALVGALVLPRVGGGDDDQADRNQVVSRANDFAVAYNTYDVADLADYQARLKGLLTPEYDRQFVEITNAVFGALETKQQKSGDAKVQGVAIDTFDDDSATAIVAVDASITNTDNAAAVKRFFRWKVTFSKTEGEWLVSNFESVASVDAQSTPVPTDPAATDAAPTTPAPVDPAAPTTPAPAAPAPTDATGGAGQ
jgi:Mce-associated membrane protein